MELEIFHCDQGSLNWVNARLGVLTASNFSVLLAKGRGGGESKQRQTYLDKLAGEILTGHPADQFSNAHTERGHEYEPEARNLHAMLRDVESTPVGFLKRGGVGCSPDSLIGEDGLLEIKTKMPHLQIAALREGGLPDEHKAQVQGQLWVSGRAWCDFLSYCPGLPSLLVRVPRDELYIATIKVAADQFLADLGATVEWLRNCTGTEAA